MLSPQIVMPLYLDIDAILHVIYYSHKIFAIKRRGRSQVECSPIMVLDTDIGCDGRNILVRFPLKQNKSPHYVTRQLLTLNDLLLAMEAVAGAEITDTFDINQST